jgi:predicted transcriptional regulator
MDFRQAALLGSYISKDYAEDLFRLLSTYSSISASEAASRLDLHIRTVQDFMEAMHELGILGREEVYEKKRPYFRYFLKTRKIIMEVDLEPLFPAKDLNQNSYKKIREKKDAGARFTTARSDQYISNVAIWSGKGRERTERKINLSIPQGRFLYHLPFPTAEFQSIASIMKKAGVDSANTSEILDIVSALTELGVIEEDKD